MQHVKFSGRINSFTMGFNIAGNNGSAAERDRGHTAGLSSCAYYKEGRINEKGVTFRLLLLTECSVSL